MFEISAVRTRWKNLQSGLPSFQVEELRTQLAQMESLTMGKSQDLEDAMEECTSKVGGWGFVGWWVGLCGQVGGAL